MKKLTISLGAITVLSLGGWLVMSGTLGASETTQERLATVEKALAAKEAEIATLKSENEILKNNAREARAYASFLSLALCPTLENEDKEALCMNDGTEWLNQTIQTGMSVPDEVIKGHMSSLLQTLGTKKPPSSKQFYELLKPLELRSLQMITEKLQ